MMFGGGSKCPRCDKSVYFNERYRALEQDWHKACFKCNNCDKGLELGKQCEREGEPYCKPCYGKLFGPKGYGFGQGAGTLQDTGVDKDGNRKDYRINKERVGKASETATRPAASAAASSRARPMSLAPAGAECPVCDKTVGFAERFSAMDRVFHRECFKCHECSKRLNQGEYLTHGEEPFCKSCHGKLFGPKGYGYGGAVGHNEGTGKVDARNERE